MAKATRTRRSRSEREDEVPGVPGGNLIDLQQFCDPDHGDQAVHRPFRFGPSCCATNGYRLIEVFDIRQCQQAPRDFQESPWKYSDIILPLLNAYYDVTEWQRMESPPACPTCGEAGWKPVQCDECGGTGKATCEHCKVESDCKECGGEGRVEARCVDCIVQLGDQYFAPEAIRGFAGLPDVYWGISASHKDHKDLAVLKFSGGRGVVMSVSKDIVESDRRLVQQDGPPISSPPPSRRKIIRRRRKDLKEEGDD